MHPAPGILAAVLQLLNLMSPSAQTNGSASGACSFGQPGAPVRIEVFSDYQCPACRELYLGTVRPLSKDPLWSRELCIVYKDIPLKKHAYSREASRYALAALQLGQAQWQRVSDALYQNQSLWSQHGFIEPLIDRALPSGDSARVKKLIRFASTDQRLDEEIADATRRQIRSVPTLFIYAHGKQERIVGGVPFNLLREYLVQIMK